MAEALAVIGIIANFAAVVDVGTKILSRLHEYMDASTRIPKAFQGIAVDLPLVLDTVSRTSDQAKAGAVSETTLRKLEPIVDRCQKMIEELGDLLIKLVPKEKDSVWRRGKKMVLSLTQEKDVNEIASGIQKLVWTLTYYQSVTGPVSNEQLAAPRALLQQPTSPGTHVRSTPLPSGAGSFIGREATLSTLARYLYLPGEHCRAALFGLGGIGKTRIALETAKLFRKENVSVFWIHASSPARFEKGYIEILKSNNIPGWDESQTQPILGSKRRCTALLLVKQWLEGPLSGNWLLILDNADDYNLLYGPERFADYLPENGSILMTTRNNKVALNFVPPKDSESRILEVTPFDELEISRFFTNKFGSERFALESAAYLELATELLSVPLALTQAAAFILGNRLSIQEYLVLYRESDKNKIRLLSADFEDAGRDHEIKNPVAATYAISFEHLRSHHHLAAKILSRMCVLDPQGVPESLLKLESNAVDTAIALGTLQAFSLITSRTEEVQNGRRNEKSFDVHRLVYLAMRSWLVDRSMLIPRTLQALTIMNTHLSTVGWENRDIWSSYLPHATRLLSEKGVEHFLPERAFMKRALHVGTYEAISIAPSVSENFEEHQGTMTHKSQNKLCVVCCATLHYKVSECFGLKGNYTPALAFAEDAFVLRNVTLGSSHPDTITSMIQVICLLTEEGGILVLEGAAILGNQAVLQSQKFGEDHYLYLESMLALASVYRKQARYKSAQDIGQKVLKTHLRLYGESDPRTWESMTDLATTYTYLHNYHEALDLMEKVAEMRCQFLGRDHPQTLLSITNLATAAILQVKNLNARRRVTGDKHPETLRCIANLAATCTALGAFRTAERLHKEVLELRQQTLGQHHPDTLTSMANLGRLYMKENRWEEGKEIFEEVVLWSKEKLGPTHPETLKRIAKRELCVKRSDNQALDTTRNFLSFPHAPFPSSTDVAAITNYGTIVNSHRGPRTRPTWEKAARKMIKILIINSRRFVGVLIPIVHFLDAVYDEREGWKQERNNNSHTAVSPLLRSAPSTYEVFRHKDYNLRFSPIASVTSKSLSDGAEWA